MIKVETIGMANVLKNNPVVVSANAVENYTFITDNDIVYLVSNTVPGDEAYVDDYTIPAGDKLNCFQVDFWAGQNLIVDEKHIAYESNKDYDDIVAGTTILTIDSNGKLAVAASAPESGIYFKVLEKVMLTEKAVKVLICVA